MHAAAATPETPEQRTLRQRATLRELAGLTLKLARLAAREALSVPPGACDLHAWLAPRQQFEHLAKCLRETLALESRIAGAKAPAATSQLKPALALRPQLEDLSAVGRFYLSPKGAAKNWKK